MKRNLFHIVSLKQNHLNGPSSFDGDGRVLRHSDGPPPNCVLVILVALVLVLSGENPSTVTHPWVGSG